MINIYIFYVNLFLLVELVGFELIFGFTVDDDDDDDFSSFNDVVNNWLVVVNTVGAIWVVDEGVSVAQLFFFLKKYFYDYFYDYFLKKNKFTF